MAIPEDPDGELTVRRALDVVPVIEAFAQLAGAYLNLGRNWRHG